MMQLSASAVFLEIATARGFHISATETVLKGQQYSGS
jgi:hypothetical protein